MFLSIIIPCFRESREQLMRSLDSIGFLTELCSWEAWIIDDGSPQGKVMEWVQERKDEHLHVLLQPNQGQSVARNNGIAQAQGEYIALLDADDEWIPDQYARLIHILQNENPDLLGLRCKSTRVPYYNGDAVQFMSQEDIIPMACGYIVKREVLGALRYTPGIYHEDEEFNTYLHLQAKHLIMTPIVAYRYHINPKSTVRSTDAKHLDKRFTDLLGVLGRIQRMAQQAATESELTATESQQDTTEYQQVKKEYQQIKKEKQQATIQETANKKLVAKALERRLHVLAMCFVADLFRSAPDTTFLHHHLNGLQRLGLFPLPPFPGIRRYPWIRRLSRWNISYHILRFITSKLINLKTT